MSLHKNVQTYKHAIDKGDFCFHKVLEGI